MTDDGTPQTTEEMARAAFTTAIDVNQRHGVLADRVEAIEDYLGTEDGQKQKGYRPTDTPDWHALLTDPAKADDKAKELARLTRWVDDIFRQLYGYHADDLPDCWPNHPLCLLHLDYLAESWKVLYIPVKRSASLAAAQAEWHIRILRAAVEQIRVETTGCTYGCKRDREAA